MSSLSLPPDPSLLASGGSRVQSGGKASGRLAHAAVEFESVLLGQWLQSAEKSFASVPGSEDEGDAGGDQMLGFAMQQLAHSIASAGGLGIAKLVQKGLEAADSETAASLHDTLRKQGASEAKLRP
jgi:Rod binding domain-containing protein